MVVERRGWIGVDLDGTTCEYYGWEKWNVFGAPIPSMIDRIRRWLLEGKDVRIVTARVGLPRLFNSQRNSCPGLSKVKRHSCHKSGEKFSDFDMALAIQAHLAPHLDGAILSVQCYKDADMIELWDDRAVQVVPNAGISLVEAHTAEIMALSGKSFGGVDDRNMHIGGLKGST